MESFTEGYVTAFPYPYGYYAELNPLRSIFPILLKSVGVPRFRRSLELGFGEGISINIHAAAGKTQWVGTDFNAAQTNFARSLAEASEAKIRLFNDSFAQFARRDDLGEFEFIGLHGIMSWISHENQKHLVDIIDKHLAVGGVLYNSYNTFPGWAPMAPVQGILSLHAEKLGNSDLAQGIDDALAFAGKLVGLDGQYTKNLPMIKSRIERLRKHDAAYLAHEYFNKNWDIIPFARMSEMLSAVKMDYVCQADCLGLFDFLNLTREQAAFVNGIRDVVLGESVRDFLQGTQFRRDYWIKGARGLANIERDDSLRQQALVLVCMRSAVDLAVRGSMFTVELNGEIYNPVLDIFADNLPHSIGEAEERLRGKGVNFTQLLEAVCMLLGKGCLSPAQEYDAGVLGQCRNLNDHIELLSRADNTINYLASPLTGGGLAVNRFDQLFLLAARHGCRKPDQFAKFAWDQLSRARHKLVVDGKALEKDGENLAELVKRAGDFERNKLPILKLHGIAE